MDFFGVSAAFSEAEEADPTLDDLVPNFTPGSAKKKAKPSTQPPASAQDQEMVESKRKFDDPLDVLDALKAMKKKRR